MSSTFSVSKEMFGIYVICSVLVTIIINSSACMATPLGDDLDGRSNMLQQNQVLHQHNDGENTGHRWVPWHENPLYQRYHAPGTDFSGRSYPVPYGKQDEATTDKESEVRDFFLFLLWRYKALNKNDYGRLITILDG